MDLKTIIRGRREQLALSKESLGRLIGCTGVHVGSIEGGTRNPSPELIGRLESALGFDKGALLEVWYTEKHDHLIKVEVVTNFRSTLTGWHLRLFDAKAIKELRGIKNGESAEVPPITLDLKKPLSDGNPKSYDSIITPWLMPHGRVGLRIEDDAMLPEILQQDIIVVDLQLTPKNGELVLVELKAKATVRRFAHDRGARILEAFDRAILPLHLRVDDMDKILGVVVAVLRNYERKDAQ
jgi:transcriptional regulator with XRE-family HTH domain